MKIALIGYGKMGKEIEKIAQERGNEIGLIIDLNNASDFNKEKFAGIDVAIEFTTPETAFDNIIRCFELGVPVVSGTTGWLSKFETIKKKCEETDGGFFHASNFSLGVNLFFELNKKLAAMMNPFQQFEVEIEEIHHTQKLDAPSGTAIVLAEGVIEKMDRKTKWEKESASSEDSIPVKSLRIENIAGIHTVSYSTPTDRIEIKHFSENRRGLAEGAVIAAEFLAGKKGIFSMSDLLKF